VAAAGVAGALSRSQPATPWLPLLREMLIDKGQFLFGSKIPS
jgi:hypothetical protein